MRVILLLTMVFNSILSFANEGETTDIYKRSLLLYLSNAKVDTVYILKCFDMKMPSKVGRFQIVDFENSKSNLVKDKGAIHAIKIMPMEINKGVIEITLVDFLISDEKGERILVNSGSQTFSYKYNSANKQYVLINKTRHSF